MATFGDKPDHDDLVIEETGRVLGLASVGPQGAAGVAWVSKVFVSKEARRRGAGRALLEAVHEAAKARGYRVVGLRTRRIFVEAVALYEAFGYARSDDPAALTPGDVVYYRPLDSGHPRGAIYRSHFVASGGAISPAQGTASNSPRTLSRPSFSSKVPWVWASSASSIVTLPSMARKVLLEQVADVASNRAANAAPSGPKATGTV